MMKPVLFGLEETLRKWKAMLKAKLPEVDYQTFLSEHAGLFLSERLQDALVISKLKLGSDYETDFLVVRDDYSMGLKYIVIEIEVPGGALFNRDGSQSRRLNTATAQIRSWKRWIDSHRACVRDLMPSVHHTRGCPPNIHFMLIIGSRHPRRDGHPDEENIHRAWLATETPHLIIRSFDYLTSNAEKRLREYCWVLAGERSLTETIPDDAQCELGRVDWPALSHSEWRDFVRSRDFSCGNLIEANWIRILEVRRRKLGGIYKVFS